MAGDVGVSLRGMGRGWRWRCLAALLVGGAAATASAVASASASEGDELGPLDGIDDDVVIDAPEDPAPPADELGEQHLPEDVSRDMPEEELPSVEDPDPELEAELEASPGAEESVDAEGPRLDPADPVAPAPDLAEEEEDAEEELDTSDIEEEPITVDELLAATSEERRDADARARAPEGPEGSSVAGAGIKDSVSTYDRREWKHSGFFMEPRLGTTGCFGPHCRGASGHDVTPGVDVGGYIGGNIAGIVDIGIEGSWGRLNAGDLQGRNVFELYGVNPVTFEDVVNAELRSYAGGDGTGANQVDFSELVVNGSVLGRTAGAGPLVRVHFIRYGRGSFYLGTGAQWRVWGNKYETELGDVELDFHGIALPAAGGLGFYPIKHLMIGAEFRYVFTHYFLSVIDHPELSTYSPMSLIDAATAEAGSSVSDGLPGFWNASVTMRVRF